MTDQAQEFTSTGEAIPKRQSKSLKPLAELLRFLWPHKMRLIAASVALVFTAIAQLSLGVGIQVLVDEGFAAQSQAGLRKAVLLMVSIGFAMACG